MERKKVALITGSTGGIGTALCKRLNQEGYIVVGNSRCNDKALATKNALKLQGCNIHMVQGDVSDFESVARMIKSIERDIGPIDILINNAGITRDARFTKMNKEDWDEVMNINLTGVFNCTRQVIDSMIERGYGRIINISSVNGQKGQFGQTNYSAAKAGLHGFTKSLALEVAKHGITVNTISPGYIGTEMVMAVPEKLREQIVAQIPVGRLGHIEEVAEAVVYLISDQSSFMTGSNLSINGGQHMY
ncbi:acetoacetyl-CoA reductase [Chryseobacterium ginsenosidimutans]|uniref:acetoacetyl-CoA reductase n=1 Tax=Chryseobacterium ginsenosidimutans TaxID=687846 RepID=UPI00277F66B8|nr:acetoacetyl-CoA reductase [Chryseobacterium ginsenosidimutans]MDQ0594366.1 acetoacetyl-CoA reductase [Chryseobacterium ginsenosidimutans]